jgi:hypothetical protein
MAMPCLLDARRLRKSRYMLQDPIVRSRLNSVAPPTWPIALRVPFFTVAISP